VPHVSPVSPLRHCDVSSHEREERNDMHATVRPGAAVVMHADSASAARPPKLSLGGPSPSVTPGMACWNGRQPAWKSPPLHPCDRLQVLRSSPLTQRHWPGMMRLPCRQHPGLAIAQLIRSADAVATADSGPRSRCSTSERERVPPGGPSPFPRSGEITWPQSGTGDKFAGKPRYVEPPYGIEP
jgi:hypothetical protein